MLSGVDWRRPAMQWLAAIAFVSNMKYGLWTATVLPEAGIKFGWEFQFVHLSLSHAGMWLQAMIFARFYKPALVPALGALLFMWFQDLIDYKALMTHPTLPYESEFAFAAGMAVAPGVVVHGRLGHDFLHPGRNNLTLDDRIADIFPVDLDPMLLEFFSHINNIPDFVGQFTCSRRHQLDSHDSHLIHSDQNSPRTKARQGFQFL